jgi:ParB family chromosome partitioning protein
LKLWREGGGAHVSYNTGENEWYTPPEYILSAREVLGSIDCDPASSDKANETVQAETYYTKDNSGLDKEWSGNVWMNPPYSGSLIKKFIDRYADQVTSGSIAAGLVLVNNATETDWFCRLVSVSDAVVFTDRRVKFLDPQGNPGAPLQGQAILYYGDNVDLFRREFGKYGWSAEL